MSRTSRPRQRRQSARSVPEAREIAAAVRASRLWRNEVFGCLKFLDGLEAATAVHGDEWAQKMKRHYCERLAVALTKVPQGCEREGERYKARLTALIQS